MTTMKAWLLKSRPVGVPTQDNWEMGEMPVPTADEGDPCICLAATDAPLRFNAFMPRLLQPLFKI